MKLSIALFMGILAVAATSAAAQQVDDIRLDMQKHDYRAALQKISRRLPDAKGNPQARFELLMMRGEALVQLKQKTSALDAFRSAFGAVQRDGDLDQAMAARAMIELLPEGSGWTLKASDGKTYDLIDMTSRKAAAAALVEARLGTLKPKIDRAVAGETLGPMLELLPSISGVMALEYLATSDISAVKPLVEALGERARNLINSELDRIMQRASELEDLANDFVMLNNAMVPDRRGLQSNETQELREMLPYLNRVAQTAEEGRRINRRLGGTGEVWDQILLRISEAESRIRGVLSANSPLTGEN